MLLVDENPPNPITFLDMEAIYQWYLGISISNHQTLIWSSKSHPNNFTRLESLFVSCRLGVQPSIIPRPPTVPTLFSSIPHPICLYYFDSSLRQVSSSSERWEMSRKSSWLWSCISITIAKQSTCLKELSSTLLALTMSPVKQRCSASPCSSKSTFRRCSAESCTTASIRLYFHLG